MNHSNDRNTRSESRADEEEMVTYAGREIQAGEEITEDYSDFEDLNNDDNLMFELFRIHHLTDEIDPRLK